MKKVYKSKDSEKAMITLYDQQLARLKIEFKDLYAETRFGKSHVIKAGKPILLFHGGNSNAPYYLAGFLELLEHFCIYTVDTIGHPGKSAQTILLHGQGHLCILPSDTMKRIVDFIGVSNND